MASFGPGGSESKTSSRVNTFDQRIAGTDQSAIDARRVSPSDHSTATALENSSQINTRGGAVALEYSSDPDIVRDSIAAVRDQSDRFSKSLTDIFAASTDVQAAQAIANAQSQKSLLEETFSKLADLAKSSQSGGDTDRNKIVLWISLAALAVVAFLVFRRS